MDPLCETTARSAIGEKLLYNEHDSDPGEVGEATFEVYASWWENWTDNFDRIHLMKSQVLLHTGNVNLLPTMWIKLTSVRTILVRSDVAHMNMHWELIT